MEDFDPIEDKIAELVGNGFFDLHYDEAEEDWFMALSENAAEIDPEAYIAVVEGQHMVIAEALEELIEKGLVEVSGINEDGEPMYACTEKGRDIAELIRENSGLF